MSWKIELFETQRGEVPVETFIDALDEITELKIIRTLDMLRDYGPALGMPHTKKMSRHVYELRIRGKVEVRIFYTYKNDIIYLLHAFQKKTQKTPLREIELAESRLELL